MSWIKLDSEHDELDKYDFYGDIFYYKKNTKIIHNEHGPAVLFKNGYIGYIIENKWHRLDGPARIWPSALEEYYIDGEKLNKEEFEMNHKRLKFLGKEYLICLM